MRAGLWRLDRKGNLICSREQISIARYEKIGAARGVYTEELNHVIVNVVVGVSCTKAHPASGFCWMRF